MAERLGIVLYWAGCILAGLWVLFMLNVQGARVPSSVSEIAVIFLPALVIWCLGKGLRFIFSGY